MVRVSIKETAWFLKTGESVVVIDQLNRVPVWNRGIQLVRIVVDETGTNI